MNAFQEVKQMETTNEQQLNEMLQRHAAEKRRLPKILKTETKTRTQIFKKSLRLNVNSMTPEQELEKLQEVCVETVPSAASYFYDFAK